MLPILSFNIDYHILRHGKRDILGMVAGILYVLSVCSLSQSTPKTKTIVLKRGGRKKSHGIPTSEEKRVEKKRRYESASEVQKTRQEICHCHRYRTHQRAEKSARHLSAPELDCKYWNTARLRCFYLLKAVSMAFRATTKTFSCFFVCCKNIRACFYNGLVSMPVTATGTNIEYIMKLFCNLPLLPCLLITSDSHSSCRPTSILHNDV